MASPLITLVAWPVLLWTATLFQHHFLSRRGLTLAVLSVLLAMSVHVTLNPFTTHPFVNGCMAFMSIYWIMRFIELTMIRDLSKSKRIRRLPFSPFHPAPAYTWQSYPKELGYERILWKLDLVINPRAVAWSHGPADYRPPLDIFLGQEGRSLRLNVPGQGSKRANNLNQSSETQSFCWLQLRRFLTAYAIADLYKAFYYSSGYSVTSRAPSESCGKILIK